MEFIRNGSGTLTVIEVMYISVDGLQVSSIFNKQNLSFTLKYVYTWMHCSHSNYKMNGGRLSHTFINTCRLFSE